MKVLKKILYSGLSLITVFWFSCTSSVPSAKVKQSDNKTKQISKDEKKGEGVTLEKAKSSGQSEKKISHTSHSSHSSHGSHSSHSSHRSHRSA